MHARIAQPCLHRIPPQHTEAGHFAQRKTARTSPSAKRGPEPTACRTRGASIPLLPGAPTTANRCHGFFGGPSAARSQHPAPSDSGRGAPTRAAASPMLPINSANFLPATTSSLSWGNVNRLLLVERRGSDCVIDQLRIHAINSKPDKISSGGGIIGGKAKLTGCCGVSVRHDLLRSKQQGYCLGRLNRRRTGDLDFDALLHALG